ncbi:protein-L-isoaspartate(D-aspartate) O-methyltransferase [Stieleria sp. ICT_E10.1]|uniref:protein-L-isoaspartate(D-aspartate) O-methyltransferase n=1 Tax=Stieleria sedimenti TaxID=2976331 RepID=UPI00218074D3|nr:protein-L-isoaspartate(D-aspartate) O-methyltransferase [Stieleria sedimenti]MCS7469645.1 protein-L-isoaspartate(D-aspartate) O-methyltransferase [Stieleria sedimenti]
MTSTTPLGLATLSVIGLILLSVATSCDGPSGTTVPSDSTNTDRENQDDSDALLRGQMVARQLAARGINNERVLDAIRRVPRHQFVPTRLRDRAYDDSPLPIGNEQTISQPYIVGLMTELVDPQADDRVLDVGTGSGYQAAVLAELVQHVDSIEIVESLAKDAAERLKSLGYKNIRVHHGDGYAGLQSGAPFDAIVVAAAPDHVPPALIDQLAPGGKMVIPVGDRLQSLMLIEKHSDGEVVRRKVAPVMFVPMTGEAEN